MAQLLIEKGVETYCPLVKQQRQWSDRVKTIALPLLATHLFVRISEEQRTAVRLTEGVVNFVYTNGKPVVLKEKLVQHIRQFQLEHPQVTVVKSGMEPHLPSRSTTAGKAKQATLWLETLNILLVAGSEQSTCRETSTDKQ